MQDIEYILDFAVNLANRMLDSGANLERVNDTMERVCRSYGLVGISIFSLSSYISVSASTTDGIPVIRQLTVSGTNIHLERLRNLNQLSYMVCAEKPAPETLMSLLNEASKVKEYPTWIIVLGNFLAAACLCGIFGGTVMDMVCAGAIMIVLYWMLFFLGATGLAKIIINVICTFVISTLAIGLTKLGIAQDYSCILIANALLIIPGIPMVNAMRNLLCGNEMNGILQFMKVLLESVTMVLGLVLSIYLFGGAVL